MDEGVIYILTNEAMPGLVKIGLTRGKIEQRMRELDTTGVPLPFECFLAYQVANSGEREKRLHDAFDNVRVRQRREFFTIAPERVASALLMADGIDVTPRTDVVEDEEDKVALERAHSRRPKFNFNLAQVPVGATLVLVKDENITCTVDGAKEVEFQGRTMSLTQAALAALHTLGYAWSSVQGPAYWEYEGETLDERRRRIEEADD